MPVSFYRNESDRMQAMVNEILDSALPLEPGVHLARGVGNTAVLTVVGLDGKRRGEMRVAADAVDVELTGFLEAWAFRRSAEPIQLVRETA